MSIDDACELDAATIYLFFEYRKHPVNISQLDGKFLVRS
jgi:hypothetical protein